MAKFIGIWKILKPFMWKEADVIRERTHKKKKNEEIEKTKEKKSKGKKTF